MIQGYDPTDTDGWEEIGDCVGIRRFRSSRGEFGLTIWHLLPSGEWCGGAVWFRDLEKGRIGWTVMSGPGEPLTLVPSIDCSCGGNHGFITNGRWGTVPGAIDPSKGGERSESEIQQ